MNGWIGYLEGHIYRKTTKLTDKEGYATSSSVTGNPLSADAFKLQTSFDNWDFTDVWMMGTDYPVFIPKHNHELTYEANGTTITATCSAEGCPVEGHTASITIYAPEDLEYTGQAFACTLTKDYNNEFFPNPKIKYYDSNDQEVQSVVDVGSYTAKLQFGDAVATLALVVTPQQPMQGDGTEANPYQIKRKDQLEEFRDIVNGLNGKTKNNSACGKLTADIDLNNEEWTPIGNRDNEYQGTFDGNKKTIKGLAINGTGNCVGLFGCIYGATIKNLIVEGSVSGDTCVGGIVGYAHAYTSELATITGCTSNVTVTGARRVGGFVGQADGNCNVSYCSNIGNITGTDNDNVGGTGGVVGMINYNTTISNCFNTGKIVSVCNAGGIVGYNYSNASSHNWVITDCYNTGDIEVTVGYAGGITSYNNGTVVKCHNVGKVITPNTGTKAAEYAGGIIGMFSDKDAYAPFYCYYLTGCVQGKTDRAGRRYQLSDPISFVGNPYSADRFKDSASFYNWDFTNVWMMGTDYPVLIPKHDHELTYEVNGATITATCSAEGCPLENDQATLTLVAPENLECDGNAKVATFEAGYNTTVFPNATINYFKDNKAVNECVYPGIYVAKVTFGNVTAEVEFTIEGHYHDDIIYKKWEATNSLPNTAGNYYLTNNVTISSTWTAPSGTTRLCLNGHGIIKTGSGRVINVSNGSTLNIYDCDNETTHKYTVSSPTSYGAGLATVNDNATGVEDVDYYTFTGGYITGGSDSNGAGVQAYSTNSTAVFNLYGGTIIGNNGSGNGGAIWAKGGTFNMYGGALLHNKANQGAGVFAPNETPFAQINLLGGRIEGNIANGHGGALYGGTSVPLTLGNIRVTKNGSLGAAAIGGITAAYATENAHLYIKDSPYVYGNYNASGPSNLQGTLSENNLQVIGSLGEDCRISFVGTAGVYNYYKSGFTHTNIDPNTLFSYDDGNYAFVRQGDHAVKVAKVSLAYNANGGTGNAPETVKYMPGETVEVLENPFTNGELIFIGWNTSADGTGTGYKAGATFGISANTTLYAQWFDYKALDTTEELDVIIPGDKEKANYGDELSVDTDATPIVVKWYYDDNNDGDPDTEEAIAEGETYKVKAPKDNGHNIIAIITQPKKNDGTDYPEGEIPTVTTKKVTVVGEKGPFFKVGNTEYIEFKDAYDACEEGDVITILKDLDNLPFEYLTIRKEVIIDLNGHILGGYTDVVSIYNVLLIVYNSQPKTGGLKTTFRFNGGLVKLFDVRLTYTAASVELVSKTIVIADGYEILAINSDNSADENGFKSIVRKIYSPLDPTQMAELDKPTHTPLLDGDVLTVETDANPVTVEWFYDDDGDGLPDDPANPIGEGMTYTVKTPDQDDPTHDDRGHTIVARVTQNTKEDGTEYPEGEKPVTYTDPIEVYTPFVPDPENPVTIDIPGSKPKAENGDQIYVDVDGDPVTVKWYYDDDHDGQPDDPANPIGEGKEYIVVCPDSEDPTHDDTGHTIIAVITQDKKPDGTDYPEGEAPTETTGPIVVKGNIGGFTPIDTSEKPVVVIPGDKEEAEEGDVLTVETDTKPVIVTWYYDDDNDGRPDSATPIGTGKTYTVVCPDPNDSTHDDTGHKIIAIIKQTKDENGDDILPSRIKQVASDAIKVEGVIPHTHNFTYKVNGTTITAKCNNAYCPITEGLTLTLVAPTGNMVYDGQPRVATLKAGYNAEAFPGATIKYFQGTTEVASCVNAGTYVAKVTFGTATAQVVFTIENWKEQDADHTEVAAEIVGAAKDENIHIKVEVKTTVSAQQTSPTDYEAIKAKLAKDEEISKVYDVKLIRTVNGQSTEIQPSDIKEGTTIIVTMDIPAGMAADFRILHIHGPNDTEFVENFTVLGKKVSFSVTRLSEFAFVAKKVNTNHGFCIGWVLFILVMLEALFLAFCSIPQILRKFDLEDKKEYFQNIGLFSSIAVTIFGIVAIAVDSCVIGLASYGASMAIIVCYVVFLVLRMRHKAN